MAEPDRIASSSDGGGPNFDQADQALAAIASAPGAPQPHHPGAVGALLAVAITTLTLASVFAFNPNYRAEASTHDGPFGGDFLQEWIGARIIRDGRAHRLYDGELSVQLQKDPAVVGFAWNESAYLPMVYPPWWYALLTPLAELPYQAAARIWGGLMLAALLATFLLVQRAARADPTLLPRSTALGSSPSIRESPAPDRPAWEASPTLGEVRSSGSSRAAGAVGSIPGIDPRWAWLMAGAALFPPVLESLAAGQKGTIGLLLVAGVWLFWRRGAALAAGILFGLLAFKPQWVVVVGPMMLLAGQGRFVIGTAVTGLVLIGLSLGVGLDCCVDYLRFATRAGDYLRHGGYDFARSANLVGLFGAFLGPSDTTVLASRVTSLFVLSGMAGLSWRLRGALAPRLWTPSSDSMSEIEVARERLRAAWFSALWVATVLISPHWYGYDLSIMLVPMLLACTGRLGDTPADARRHLGFALLLWGFAGISPALARSLGVNVVPLVLLGWLIALVRTALAAEPGLRTAAIRASAESPRPVPKPPQVPIAW